MNRFSFVRARNVPEAITAVHVRTGATFLDGGAHRVDLLEEDVAGREALTEINRFPLLDRIETKPDGGLSIGALVTNADIVYHSDVVRLYPLLAKAVLAGTRQSPGSRPVSGGNRLMRTRCYYFYDPIALGHPHARPRAIVRGSERGVAPNPSDIHVALAALEANIHVEGPRGSRVIPIAEFRRFPGNSPGSDRRNLEADELIVAIELPPNNFGACSAYVKVRDRGTPALGLVSVAAAMEISAGKIVDVRLALGRGAGQPWRDRSVEKRLIGNPATTENFRAAARDLVCDTDRLELNRCNSELAQRAVVRALRGASSCTAWSA